MAQSNPNEVSHEMQSQRRLQLVYSRLTEERRIFMEGLFNYRKRKDKETMKEIRESRGTTWYQAFSVPQILALDTLETSIYQDLLEARPSRTQTVMKALGIIPIPKVDDLMHCIYFGRHDPKEMLAQLFLLRYNHVIDLKRMKYDLNARLILSGILYLGLPELIQLLEERFAPDQPEPPPKPKKRPKPEPPLPSPYLQKMVAVCYEPRKSLRKPPPPLPNLDYLNEPLEDDTPPVIRSTVPPPPPPPPPKKRLPRALCDKAAGMEPVKPLSSMISVDKRAQGVTPVQAVRKLRKSKFMPVEKKAYGIGDTRKAMKGRRRKPKAPHTSVENTQYTICGVAKIRGKVVFILGNVTVLNLEGDIIHGGHALVNGEYINIHRGIRGSAPPPASGRCDCVKIWTAPVLKYLKNSKCYCDHYYDFYHEDTFPKDEIPYFEKPTRHGPMQINYDQIYELDPKSLHVGKEFKRIWDTESALHIGDPTKKKPQVKKKKRSSKTCLGTDPKPQDYLRCALHRMRHITIGARLPDIHLVPELMAWMHHRLYGPYTRKEKRCMKLKSNVYWTLFKRFATLGIPHVPVPKVQEFMETTTWQHKQALTDKFRKFANVYRLKMFRTHAAYTNMMWPSMFQAQVPDKKFREIYYSYLFGTINNVALMHPYSSIETEFHYTRCIKRPYRCIPDGAENIEH